MLLERGILWFEDGTEVSNVSVAMLKAVPDMLAALEFFKAQWEDVEDGDIGEAYVRTVEAIKKAKGGS